MFVDADRTYCELNNGNVVKHHGERVSFFWSTKTHSIYFFLFTHMLLLHYLHKVTKTVKKTIENHRRLCSIFKVIIIDSTTFEGKTSKIKESSTNDENINEPNQIFKSRNAIVSTR